MKKEILFADPWIRVVKLDGWYTAWEEVQGDGICVVVISKDTKEALVRIEHTPPHGEGFNYTSITGLMDKTGETAIETAVRELEEEANIKTTSNKLIPLSYVYPSKASNFKLYRFVTFVDKASVSLTMPKGDNTEGEKGAHCIWMTYDQIFSEVKCPTFLSILGKLYNLDSI